MNVRGAVLTGLIIALTTYEVLLLIVLAFFPYIPDPGVSSLSAAVHDLLAPFSPILLLGLLYAWLLRFGMRKAGQSSGRFNSIVQFLSYPFEKTWSSVRSVSLSASASRFKTLIHPKLFLGLSLVTSVLLALVPYRPDLNPAGNLVGVDSPLYVTWVSQMLQRPVIGALQYSFVEGLEGSRPFLLIPLYIVAMAGYAPSQIVEFLPLVLAPLLSLSSYVFVRFGHGSPGLAGLTSLFTPLSFYLTVGIWGGYYANMLALIFVYLFFTFFLLFSKSPSAPKYCATFALSVALFLTHPWTWAMIVMVCLAFALSIWRETNRSIHLKSIVGIIIAGIALDLLKSGVFATRTVVEDLATKLPTGGQVGSFWTNLVATSLYTHGGLLGNWIILSLGLLAGFAFRFRDWFERLIILWVGVASIPFLTLGSYHQARIVYDLPIPIMMSTAVLVFVPQIGAKNILWPELVVVLLLAISVNYALQGILLL